VFLAQCDNLGREALIWASDLEGIINTEAGIVLRYRCACGQPDRFGIRRPCQRPSGRGGLIAKESSQELLAWP